MDGLQEILQLAFSGSAWDDLGRRSPALKDFLEGVLFRGSPPLRRAPFDAQSCSEEAKAHHAVWSSWPAVRRELESAIAQKVETARSASTELGNGMARYDIFPAGVLQLLYASSLDVEQSEFDTQRSGQALLDDLERVQKSLQQLFDSISEDSAKGVQDWDEAQVQVLDFNPCAHKGSLFASTPFPFPAKYLDAVGRTINNGTRADLVITGPGHITYGHNDENLLGFSSLQIKGYKLWLIWPGTLPRVRAQLARAAQKMAMKDLHWCFEALGQPEVYIMEPGSILVGNPGYIHAVLSLSPSAHWTIAFASGAFKAYADDAKRIWKRWLRSKSAMRKPGLEDEGQPGFLAKFVSEWRTTTKDGEAVWMDWHSLHGESKEEDE